MAFELMKLANWSEADLAHAVQKLSVEEIMNCNDFTANYGLALTQTQAFELTETRSTSLNENGRIEFGGGAIDKLIKGFCDSPYLSEYNYVHTLHELIEIFYYYKNEMLDLMSDEDLVRCMREKFDGVCQGSLERLSELELAQMAKNIRYGYAPDRPEDALSDHEEEEDEYGQY